MKSNITERYYNEKIMALILAGGRGSRLFEMTNQRAKPMVPFGAKFRFIDCAVSNIRNSQLIKHTYVLTQYESQGIQNHLNDLSTRNKFWDFFIEPLPAQQTSDSDDWYIGTANAVFQNFNIISSDEAEHVIIMAADHIYKLDVRPYYRHHLEHNADITVCGRFMPIEMAAREFGVMEFSANMLITNFEEKPEHPKEHFSRQGECFGSMGIYIFKKSVLLKVLQTDHENKNSEHDFGKDIIPKMIADGDKVIAYDHGENIIIGDHAYSEKKRSPYWRDVGTIDAYWKASMDLVSFDPDFDFYNEKWPIISVVDYQPPFKLMTTDDFNPSCENKTRLVSAGGTIPTDVILIDVILGRKIMIDKNAKIHQSILFDGVEVGASARITKAIICDNVTIPPNCIIGESIEDDEARDIRITDSGVRLVHSGSRL